MADVVGSAFLGVAVTPVGKQVFLLVVAVTPIAMHGMTTTAATVQKAAGGRSKSPPLAVKKQLIVSLSLTLPTGREFILVVFEEVVVHTFPVWKVRKGLWWTGRTPGNSYQPTKAPPQPSPWEGTEKVPHPLQIAG